MNSVPAIIAARHGDVSLDRDTVRCWMHDSDLATKAALYLSLRKILDRVEPRISEDEERHFIMSYLVDCIVANPPSGEFSMSGFEAASELAAWLKHLQASTGQEATIRRTESNLRVAYHKADEPTRNRIETGALERIFENSRLVTYFDEWKRHRQLRDAYKEALKWGKAHPDTP